MSINDGPPYKAVSEGTVITVPVVDKDDNPTGEAVTLRWEGTEWRIIKRWKIDDGSHS